MADNTTINTPVGNEIIATDEVTTLNGNASSGVKIQRVKATFGDDNTARDVSSTFPLPTTALTDAQLRAANVPTTLASLVYPASTGNNTTTQLAAGATFTGTAETIQNLQAAQISIIADQPITVFVEQFLDAGATKLVSQDTFTRLASVPLNENVSLPGDFFRIRITNTGASATTTLQAGVTFGIMETGPRTLTNLGNNKTAINEVGGTAVATGAGVVNAGTQRVVLATDQPGQTPATFPVVNSANNTIGNITFGPIELTGESVSFHLTSIGTGSPVFTPEVSNDGTTWVGAVAVTSTGATLNTTVNVAGLFQVSTNSARYFRLRVSTAGSGGTITGAAVVRPSSTLRVVSVAGAVDTELPAAAALADGAANPTTPIVGVANLLWNGTTWDRRRPDSSVINVDASSARVASGTGVTYTVQSATNLIMWINVTAVSGTTPTCQFRVQWSPDGGTTWIDLDNTNLQGTAVTGVTTQTFRLGPNVTTVAGSAAGGAKQDIVPSRLRLAWTITGTSPSFTFASWFTTTG